MEDSIKRQLNDLKQRCLRCTKCAIGGNAVGDAPCNVFSSMSFDAKIMVVGQNPGFQEVVQGVPFVGPSGKFFDTVMEKILGITRDQMYVTNTVKCYTEGNRKPYQKEVDNCRPFLDEEIKLVAPKVIITLGGPALKQVTGLSGIMKHHGERIASPRYSVYVVPLLHPSPLNTNQPEKRKMFMDDIEKLKEFLE